MDEITGRPLGTIGADTSTDSVALLTSHYARKHGSALLTIDAERRAHVFLPGTPRADAASHDAAWIVGTWDLGRVTAAEVPHLASDIRDQIDHHLQLAAGAAGAYRRARARHAHGAHP
jgi:hypothetical protein